MWKRVVCQDDQKCDLFKIPKRMVKINQDIIGEQYTRNDHGVLAVSEEDKKRAWKSYHEELFNVEFLWDKDSCRYNQQLPQLIDKDKRASQ